MLKDQLGYIIVFHTIAFVTTLIFIILPFDTFPLLMEGQIAYLLECGNIIMDHYNKKYMYVSKCKKYLKLDFLHPQL